jgi:hypothetical protein
MAWGSGPQAQACLWMPLAEPAMMTYQVHTRDFEISGVIAMSKWFQEGIRKSKNAWNAIICCIFRTNNLTTIFRKQVLLIFKCKGCISPNKILLSNSRLQNLEFDLNKTCCLQKNGQLKLHHQSAGTIYIYIYIYIVFSPGSGDPHLKKIISCNFFIYYFITLKASWYLKKIMAE